jgi:bifunctional non-homologous end joining protein LigD
MRDGAKTPEPVPADAPGESDGATFVIQEHHARRLHYDFRLEHDGVLVSWALPKGVPTDRTTNHLAVQTEDHPLEYGSFEGTIPAGEYGAGEVTIWDAGTFELEKWRDGEEVIATLHGEKHGSHRYALIHTGSGGGKNENNWLIHLMDDADTAPPAKEKSAPKRSALPSPMLATLGTEGSVTDDENWSFEMKWDGYRAIADVSGGEVRLLSRNGNDLTSSYPELAELARAIDGDAVLDGEIVALGRGGAPDFSRLQSRGSLTRKAEVEKAAKATPVRFMVFDILEREGESVVKRSYDERRELLEHTVKPRGVIDVPPAFEGDLESAMDSSRALRLEGVMAKRRDARYSPGRRTDAWIKIKHHATQEVVIIGWRPGKGSRAQRIGSLLLAVPDADALRYVGRVGTGFSEKDLDALLPRLRRIERVTNPAEDVPGADARDANWVSPQLVGEVDFAEWTPTGRLRQPSWRGFRPDKNVGDVVVER